MCQGGIYDHLGGGFSRYATDAEWLVPHFEKMLYDNAALLDLLAHVWQESREPLYEQRIRETVAWLLREMRRRPQAPTAGAPSPARWMPIARASKASSTSGAKRRSTRSLGADAPLFKQHYDVTPRAAIGKAIRSSIAAPGRC